MSQHTVAVVLRQSPVLFLVTCQDGMQAARFAAYMKENKLDVAAAEVICAGDILTDVTFYVPRHNVENYSPGFMDRENNALTAIHNWTGAHCYEFVHVDFQCEIPVVVDTEDMATAIREHAAIVEKFGISWDTAKEIAQVYTEDILNHWQAYVRGFAQDLADNYCAANYGN